MCVYVSSVLWCVMFNGMLSGYWCDGVMNVVCVLGVSWMLVLMLRLLVLIGMCIIVLCCLVFLSSVVMLW